MVVRRCGLTNVNILRDTEIGDFHASLVIDEYNGAPEVTVNDIALMQVGQSLKNLSDKVPDERLFECTVIAQQRSDRTTWHIFEKDVEDVILQRRVCCLHQGVFIRSGERLTEILDDVIMLQVLQELYYTL